LLLIVVALAGGIIWYNFKKSNQLAIAAAERLMQQAGEDISNRIKLLYDPCTRLSGIASLVPELTSPAIKDDARAFPLILRVLRIYPQILSFYVGFDDGEFFIVTHITGENSAELRTALNAPHGAVFANEIVSADAGGERRTQWVLLAEDGAVVGRGDPVSDRRLSPGIVSIFGQKRVDKAAPELIGPAPVEPKPLLRAVADP
jgi:hypothetical protein